MPAKLVSGQNSTERMSNATKVAADNLKNYLENAQDSDLKRRALLLLNVISEANQLKRHSTLPSSEFVIAATGFGIRLALDEASKDKIYENYEAKLNGSAELLLSDRKLATDACMGFINQRASRASGAGNTLRILAEYVKTLHDILKVADTMPVNQMLRGKLEVERMLLENKEGAENYWRRVINAYQDKLKEDRGYSTMHAKELKHQNIWCFLTSFTILQAKKNRVYAKKS